MIDLSKVDLSKVKPGDMLGVKWLGRDVAHGLARVERSGGHGECLIWTDCLHPLPEPAPAPHTKLRDAVVEDARAAVTDYRMMGGQNRYVDRMGILCRSVDALNAALAPPDLLGELLAAARAAVVLTGYCYDDRARLRAAIAAVEAERRA